MNTVTTPEQRPDVPVAPASPFDGGELAAAAPAPDEAAATQRPKSIVASMAVRAGGPAAGASAGIGAKDTRRDWRTHSARIVVHRDDAQETVSGSYHARSARPVTDGAATIGNAPVAGGRPIVMLRTGQHFSSTRCGSWVTQG